MMDGRVKTLHPNIHGGLLARRDLDSHLEAAKDNQIELIDLVVVNLYPFKETILKLDVTYADAVENIDIGGPSMLRSAAKNHASVTVVVDPADYAVVLPMADHLFVRKRSIRTGSDRPQNVPRRDFLFPNVCCKKYRCVFL